ncbi:MAG TPA: FMN-binding protein [Gaiellaceae bacterium]|nr:FMN-binding protein [Gaiellaceae bacterium]
MNKAGRAIPAVVSALALVAPVAPALAKTKPKKKKPAATTRTVQGPSVDMQWGPIQVTVKIKGKAIVDVSATYPTERPRSQFINEQAIPMLRQEVLQLQSAQIDLIGGATMTSEAYAQSLQAALDKANF